MLSPVLREFYRRKAQTFAGMARMADNDAMAQLYDHMAEQYTDKADGLDETPSITPSHIGDNDEIGLD